MSLEVIKHLILLINQKTLFQNPFEIPEETCIELAFRVGLQSDAMTPLVFLTKIICFSSS